MSKDTSQAGLVDNLIAEFRESLRRDGLDHSTRLYAECARHFVVWLEHDGALLADADDAQLQRFAHHSCECAGFAHRKWPAPTLRLSAYGAVRFLRFLEARGLVHHPGEVAEGFRLAEAFARSLRAQGFQPSTADTYRRTFTHFVVWLHQCRIPLDRIHAGVAARFAAHDCLCLGPPWRPPVKRLRHGRRVAARVARFADFRAGGDARAGEPVCQPRPPDPRLEPFRQWLLRERGIAECSVGVYLRTLRLLLRDIGYDVARYGAALLRDAVLRQFEGKSPKRAQLLTTAFRAYLRYLASTGQCDTGLLGAVPTARTWALAAIDTCDPSTAVGVRNRAILLRLQGQGAAQVPARRRQDAVREVEVAVGGSRPPEAGPDVPGAQRGPRRTVPAYPLDRRRSVKDREPSGARFPPPAHRRFHVRGDRVRGQAVENAISLVVQRRMRCSNAAALPNITSRLRSRPRRIEPRPPPR